MRLSWETLNGHGELQEECRPVGKGNKPFLSWQEAERAMSSGLSQHQMAAHLAGVGEMGSAG